MTLILIIGDDDSGKRSAQVPNQKTNGVRAEIWTHLFWKRSSCFAICYCLSESEIRPYILRLVQDFQVNSLISDSLFSIAIMQRSNVPASSSSSATKPMHMADFAAYDEEGLLRYFMHDTGKSRDQIKQDFTTQWGGVKAFMDFCRKEKAYHDKMMQGALDRPVVRLGVSHHRVPMLPDSSFPLYSVSHTRTRRS
jgi:hypothetical protein